MIIVCGFSIVLGTILPALSSPINIGDVLYLNAGMSETLTANFSEPDGGVSVETYSGFVELSVSGVGQSLGDYLNDAFYLFTGPQTPAHNAEHHQLVFDTQALVPLNPLRCIKYFIVYDKEVNFEVTTAPYVPVYSSDHIYNFVVDLETEAPSNLHFGVSDGKFYDNDGAYTIEISQLQAVPEPATIILLGSCLIGIAGFRKKFKKKQAK